MRIEELFFEADNNATGELTFIFDTSKMESFYFAGAWQKILKIQLGNWVSKHILNTAKRCKIKFGYVPAKELNKQNIEKVRKEIEAILVEYELDMPFVLDIIDITSVPDHLIEADSIAFFAEAPDTSISGLDKVIKCRSFYLNKPMNVTGGVLTLVKMKNIVTIVGHIKPTWVKFVDKYLNTMSHDILGCQEELIEAGLKQYAKL